MKILELLNNDIEEGVNDPHIFKCIFLFGPMGAGKSTVARPLLGATGLRTVSLDSFNEMFVRKGQVPTGNLSPDQLEYSWQLSQKQQENFIEGRLGILIDGSGRNPNTAIGVIEKMMPLGYEFMMIFVDASLRKTIRRQRQRAEKQIQQWGFGRKVDIKDAFETYKQIKALLGRYSGYFGPNRFVYINNETTSDLSEAAKKVNAFLNLPITQPAARQWIQSQKGGQQVVAKQDKQIAGAQRQAAALKQYQQAPLRPNILRK